MKEYKVKISEIRYEYIDAKSPCDAIIRAKKMALTNADEIKCEIIDDEGTAHEYGDLVCPRCKKVYPIWNWPKYHVCEKCQCRLKDPYDASVDKRQV